MGNNTIPRSAIALLTQSRKGNESDSFPSPTLIDSSQIVPSLKSNSLCRILNRGRRRWAKLRRFVQRPDQAVGRRASASSHVLLEVIQGSVKIGGHVEDGAFHRAQQST